MKIIIFLIRFYKITYFHIKFFSYKFLTMIQMNEVNPESFQLIQLDDKLEYHEPFYVVSFKKDISFISPIINIKSNIELLDKLNDFFIALIIDYDIIKPFISSYYEFINSSYIKEHILKLLNNRFKIVYDISMLEFSPEKIFFEDDEHVCFNMYSKDCSSTEIMNSVCPQYMQNVFPKKHFITPYYEHKQTKFYIQEKDLSKKEIDYDTFMKVYKQYNNLQFIFGLSNINIQPKYIKFIYSQHKYVKEVILSN